MRSRLLNLALRVVLLTALVASTILFVDYRAAGTSGYCADTGCAAVRASEYSHIFGISLPAIGIAVFLGLYASAIWASLARHYRVLAYECGAVALGALGLIGLQLFAVEAVCPWCMLVDGSALLAAVLVWLIRRDEPAPEATASRFLWAGVGVVALAVPLFWGGLNNSRLAPGAAALQSPDRVTLVTFTDFECPHCRRLHPELHGLLDAHPDKLALVRLMHPLSGHKGAEPAARAYLCAPEAKREQLADMLYSMKRKSLRKESIHTVALAQGIEGEAFATCIDAPETSALLEQHHAWFRESELRGLPSTFVNGRLVVGADVDKLKSVVEQALAGSARTPLLMYQLLLALVLAAVLISLRLKPPAPELSDPERS